jgi:uncharacterized lipoprotein YddW (UPF0748 family)
MKKILQTTICLIMVMLSPQVLLTLHAQQQTANEFPSDRSLLALVETYLHTPVKKINMPDTDVFLQRDMTAYLHSTVLQPPVVLPSEADHGHDHKDAMLLEFLNRPHPNVATLNKYFNQAALEFNVPVSLLMATAQVQSNWAQVSESLYGSWGVMGLVENEFVKQVSKSAELLQVDAALIKENAKMNIRGAAALLAYYQRNKPTPTKIEDWFESVEDLTGLRGADMKHELASRIFNLAKTGSKTVTLWGEIILIEPIDIQLAKWQQPGESTGGGQSIITAVDYPNAIPNFTTCNYNSRPAGSNINFYFVHYVATGTYQGAIDWFKNCTSSVSAHYVVRNSDGQVSQVVAEASRAWSQGVTLYNDQGIGVEHEVLATNLSMWDSEPMLVGAANLCINVCNRWAIPKVRRVTNGDRAIYGHGDVKATDCPNLTAARWTNFIARLSAVTASAPVLYSVESIGSGTDVKVTWKANIEPTLAGYRLYYANNDALTSWSLAADENTLGPSTTSVTLNASQFINVPAGDVYHFKLTAVAADGTNPLVESSAGDIYSRSSNVAGPKVLIVDGFDRFGGSGSYTSSTHRFSSNYFRALRNKAQLQVSSVANEKVEDGTFVLSNYDMVLWYVGDESTTTIVFSTAEKNAIKAYLEGGGKFLVTGSEIAYALGRTGSGTIDLNFFNNYLKATYVVDGSSTYTPANGITGTPFEGLSLPFGLVYPEDFPDAVLALTATTPPVINIFNYAVSPNKAGVAYKGIFGAGVNPGALVYLSFALETVADSSMTDFMHKALLYFDFTVFSNPVAIEDFGNTQTASPKRINVLANDINNGTAFNPTSLSIVTNPANGTVSLDNQGNVTYTSNVGFTGDDQFQYRVQNINGQFSNTANVFIRITAAVPCNPATPEVDDNFPKRELRGAWIASVYNLDWPTSRSSTPAQQQAQLTRILDTLVNTGINAVFLQIRPESDALYQSSIEPWSYWLTGTQGVAPSPLWDPLSFAISEAHKRGLELHAWINPYRAKQGTPVLASNHVATVHPEWTFVAGTVTLLNPGIPDVRAHLANVISDIARRYNVDGIHFDDYFYPTGMGTQDNATYTTYNPTAIATIQDWRRNNVNLLIARVYDTIQVINQENNSNILFGVSPFGIWKSGTPTGITGQSSFSDLYCDPIAWMQAGKVDYLAPQLYWKISGPQDYNSLSKWWNDQAAVYDRPIYMGVGLHKLSPASSWPVSEITNQININRNDAHAQVKGQIFYSSKYLVGDTAGVKTTLQLNQFKYKSIPPVLPWKDVICPNAPLNIRRDVDTIRWDIPAAAGDGDLPKRYVVYKYASAAEAVTYTNDAQKVFAIVYENKFAVPSAQVGNSYFTVTSLDKNNNESDGGNVIVLPITGLNLTVQLSGNTSMVKWKTLSENNTSHFEVERSTDGRNFQYLASVTAAGSSSSQRNYEQQDLLQVAGTYYYRIRSIDKDGRSSYSEIKSVVYKMKENQLLVGPNPFTTRVNISNIADVERVVLLDMTGRVLYRKQLRNHASTSLEIPNLPAGMYQLKLTKNNGEFILVKLVRQ